MSEVDKYSTSDRLAVSLGCIATAVAILLVIAEKSSAWTVLLLVVMAGTLVYPVLHFVRGTIGRVAALFTIGIVMVLLGYAIWPTTAVEFHIEGYEVAFNRRNVNELIANIYVENDGSDAMMSAVTSSALGRTESDSAKRQALIDAVMKNIPTKGDFISAIRFKEKKWFTDSGTVLTAEQREQWSKGQLTFYFAGRIFIERPSSGSHSLDYCGFTSGNNPKVIIDCPAKRE